jgi:dipeptidyl aminopeptidase/acylaminoacyl peptidase
MTPDDVFDLAWVSDPRLSPDGLLVAYCVTTLDREANRHRSAIFVGAVDGSQPPRNLTSGDRIDNQPRWSQDGSRIAFVSDRADGPRQLYVVAAGGGEPLRLTDLPEDVRTPAWSPGGDRLVFAARVPDSIYEQEDGRRRPHRFSRLQYKLDNEGWTGDRRSHLFVVPADGSARAAQLTFGDFEDVSPSWSPDGARIAFVSSRDEDWDLQFSSDVYVVGPDGGEPERLTSASGYCEVPEWAPDGSRLAFRYTPGIYDDPHHAQIAVVPGGGGEPRILTAALDRNCSTYPPPRGPAWDGNTLLFAAEDHGNWPLYRVPADGSAAPEVLVGGDFEVIGWDTANGVVVHTISTPTALTELYHGDTRLTSAGESFRRGRELVEPEPFTATSPDGTEVDAWIMRPLAAEPGKRYPVLLNIHGGPFTQYGNHFFDEFQVYAAAGYVVLYSNPRGASGSTEEWGRAIRGRDGWGSVDYDDLMAVMSEALRRFDFCDPDRLGVLGGSYGGFMTSWIVGHTDRFRAAVSERAVNHLVSFHGSSDQGFTFKGYFGSFVWEDIDTYLRLSPATYADAIRTPLLILHSEDDLRCPVEQAEQLFTTLRLMKRDVEFVRFPHGEGHELSRSGSPAHRAQRFEIILDWFVRKLRPWGNPGSPHEPPP